MFVVFMGYPSHLTGEHGSHPHEMQTEVDNNLLTSVKIVFAGVTITAVRQIR
jgi:hypothetical protein